VEASGAIDAGSAERSKKNSLAGLHFEPHGNGLGDRFWGCKFGVSLRHDAILSLFDAELERHLQRAFDCAVGWAVCAVGAFQGRRRGYQAHDVEQAFWFEGLGHADDCAELMAG
jgi:hypothetical protein